MRDNKPPAMRVRDRSYTKKSPFPIIEVFKPKIIERKGDEMANASNSLAHTKWMCKYHMARSWNQWLKRAAELCK